MLRHLADLHSRRREHSLQRVFESAVNDSLGGNRLSRSQTVRFEQQGPGTAPKERIEKPKSGRPAAEDQHVKLHPTAVSIQGAPSWHSFHPFTVSASPQSAPAKRLSVLSV